MATTTNYGWTTPDDTALVKDGAAAIRTLGSSVDTTTKALNPSTTLGDIEYRSSTANTNTRLGIGSTGNVLTVSGGVPTWAAPAGGGKVLQVVQAQSTTATTIASTTYTDTTLTASITPSANTSKVLVIFAQVYYHERGLTGGASESGIGVKLLRGATDVLSLGGSNADKSSYIYVNAGANSGRGLGGVLSASYLDSPATTSSTTYKTQGRVASTADGGTSSFQPGSTSSTMLLLEIGA
jgi:hypothetical protein